MAEIVLGALRDAAAMVFDPSQRIYWLFLLSAGVIGIVVSRIAPRSTPAHGSSWLDVKLLLTNSVLGALATAAWTLSAFGFAVFLVGRLDAAFGAERIELFSPTTVCLVYTVVLFVAWDASRFLLHWLMHVVPALWELHKVHHSAERLTPLTLYRAHPIESALYAARGVFVTGVITGVFFHLFRRDAVELELLGVNALGFLFNLVGANLRHSHVWWSWGRLERFLLSPAQHQVHHSADAWRSSNLGTWLAIWDRLAGTFRASGSEPPAAFGLAPEERNHDPNRLGSALWHPVRAAAGRLRPRAAAVLGVCVIAWALPARAAAPAPEPEPIARVYEGPVESPPPPDAEAAPVEAHAPRGPPPPPATAPIVPPDPAPLEEDEGYRREVVVGSMFDGDIPRVAGSAQVIGKAELERHEYDDFHRVVASVPGVYVRGEDGYGLRPNIGLRGANPDRSSKVTLMEDGILMAPAPYAAPAAYYFPLTTRLVGVEVFKGPASVRFGPNTIGGAINLRTRDIPETHESVADVAGGRYGYAKGHAYYGTTYKGFGVLLEAAHLQSNGFKELDTGGDTGFAKNDTMMKLGWRSTPGRRVSHSIVLKGGFANEGSNETYLGLSAEDFATTPYRRYAASAVDRMTWWRTQGELTYLVDQEDTLAFEARLYRHDFQRVWKRLDSFRDGPDLSTVLANPDAGQLAVLSAVLRGEENSATPEQALMVTRNDRAFVAQGGQGILHWRPQWKLVRQDLELGARLHNDFIVRDHTLDAYLMTNGAMVPEGTPSVPATRNRGEALAAAFHLHDAVTLWDRFTIAPGLRVEVISTQFEDHLTDEQDRVLDTVVIPGIGALVDATRWLAVFAGVHRGFSPVPPGQPADVKPEFSINYEAGLRSRHKGLHAEAIGFFNDYSNLSGVCTFSSGCDAANVDAQYNAGAVWVYGLESLVRYTHAFANGLRLSAGAQYTYTGSQFRTEFRSAFTQFGDVEIGDELPYVPVHLAGGELGAGGRIWDVSARLSYTGQMRDVAGQGPIPPEERVPGFLILDLTAEVRVLERIQLYALLNNATANAYIASLRPYGIRPGAPLTFIFGVKAHIF